MSNLEKKLKAVNSNNSKNQTFCNQMEELIKKLDENYAEMIRTIKPEDCNKMFVNLNDCRS